MILGYKPVNVFITFYLCAPRARRGGGERVGSSKPLKSKHEKIILIK